MLEKSPKIAGNPYKMGVSGEKKSRAGSQKRAKTGVKMGFVVEAAEKFGHRYPWDRWLARPEIVLERGQDFPAEVEPSSIMAMARVQLAKRGLLRTIKVQGSRVFIGPKTDFRGAKRRKKPQQPMPSTNGSCPQNGQPSPSTE